MGGESENKGNKVLFKVVMGTSDSSDAPYVFLWKVYTWVGNVPPIHGSSDTKGKGKNFRIKSSSRVEQTE